MKHYFDSLFLIKSKPQLSLNIESFIEKAALIGFSEFSIKKLLIALRVLYPDPAELSDKNLLNFLTLLALSSSYFKKYDYKSANYIEKCLDIVEEKFSGKKTVEMQVNGSKDPIKIEYFDKIPTEDKVYNKNLRLDEEWFKSFIKSYGQIINNDQNLFNNNDKELQFMEDGNDFLENVMSEGE